MAQEQRSRKRRLRLLAARYGIGGSRGVAIACVALVVLLGTVGFCRATLGHTAVISRAGDSAAGSESVAPAGKESEQKSGQSSTGEGEKKEETKPSEVVVHVDGAVATPGVYSIRAANPRVKDAVDKAGGLSLDADTSAMNLAEPLADGQKVHVPREGEVPPAAQQEAGASLGDEAAQTAQDESGLININTATEEELRALPGVGEATAASIVEERSNNGPFSAPEDIMRVSGIGEKKFEKMKGRICV